METQGPICRLERTIDRSACLYFCLSVAAFVMCQTAYAGCAQCTTNALLEGPVSSGEWLLTKQVNEVNVPL
jgi:hypothetical protein